MKANNSWGSWVKLPTRAEMDALTDSSDGTLDNIIYYKKRGGIVSVIIASNALTDSNTWVTLGTLPVGYRPLRRIYFVGYNNNASETSKVGLELQILPEGTVQVWPFDAGTAVRGNCMFFAV